MRRARGLYNCAYCYLKGTFRFYGQKPNGRIPQIFKDRPRIEKIRAFLKADLELEIINMARAGDAAELYGSTLQK